MTCALPSLFAELMKPDSSVVLAVKAVEKTRKALAKQPKAST